MSDTGQEIRVAIVGLGNCASSLIEGITYYSQNEGTRAGLLFPVLAGYSVPDIRVKLAFDVSAFKVGRPIAEAIYQPPNDFRRIEGIAVENDSIVLRGVTLDGNPPDLAELVPESAAEPVDVAEALREHRIDVVVNMTPTGSGEATEFYASEAADAGAAFVNCIPTQLAQREDFQKLFVERNLPLLGDDIKSQVGSTIVQRMLLKLVPLRGAKLVKTSQINLGGNTDFRNFVKRSATKVDSKRNALSDYVGDAPSHAGLHFDRNRGNQKEAFIDLEMRVFGGSPVHISLNLKNDDKPNAAGSVVDLVRTAKWALDRGLGGPLPEVCSFYMKSPPRLLDDEESMRRIRERWGDAS